jgi:hypothetical protein
MIEPGWCLGTEYRASSRLRMNATGQQWEQRHETDKDNDIPVKAAGRAATAALKAGTRSTRLRDNVGSMSGGSR